MSADKFKYRLSLAAALFFLVSLPALPACALVQDKGLDVPGPIAITGSSDTSTAGNAGSSSDATAVAPVTSPATADSSSASSADDILIHAPYNKDKFSLAPIRFLENYVGIRWSNSQQYQVNYNKGVESSTHTRSLRGLTCYIVGTIGKHLSTYDEIGLLTLHPHTFFSEVTRVQFESNWGTSQNNFMIRGGACSQGRGLGFSDFDRQVGSTSPLFFSADNGFSNASGKSLSLEYTGPHLTTGKIFYYRAAAPVTTAASNLSMGYPTGLGFTFEKVIGKEGLSGIQSILQLNFTPGVYETLTEKVGKQTIPFLYGAKTTARDRVWYFMANKTFQDKEGAIRLELSSGCGVWDNYRLLTGKTALFDTVGGGYYFQILGYPVRGKVATYARYDQYLPNDHNGPNTFLTQWDVATGVAIVLPGPLRSYGKINFDYQMVGFQERGPSHRFFIGWSPFTTM